MMMMGSGASPSMVTNPEAAPRGKRRKQQGNHRLSALASLGKWLQYFSPFVLLKQGVNAQFLWVTYSLLVFGLLALFSASANYSLGVNGNAFGQVLKQLVFVVLGLGIMGWMAQFPYQKLKNSAWVFGLVVAGLLFLTLAQGVTTNGSERWLPLGPFQFQPSELAKPAVVMLMAAALSQLKNKWQVVGKFSLLVLVMILFIYKQPNLSISLLLLSTWLGMLFMGGVAVSLFATVLPLGFMGVWFQIQHTPYQL